MKTSKSKVGEKVKVKLVNMYTVVWRDEVRAFYDIPKNDHGIILLEDTHGIKFNVSKKKIGRPKMRYATVYPFFESKEEAEGYRAGNTDWVTIKTQVLLYKP